MYRSSDCTARRASLALRSPACAISSRRVFLAPTRANSAATKKAFARTRTTTATRPRKIGGDSGGSIRSKSSSQAPPQRGRRLIRRLAVPPLEALEPYLPRIAGADPETRRIVAAIVEDVATRGDPAVREYTLQFDGVDLPPEAWELESAGWQSALGRIAAPLRAALATSVQRVTEYHKRQRETGFHLTEDDGS